MFQHKILLVKESSKCHFFGVTAVQQPLMVLECLEIEITPVLIDNRGRTKFKPCSKFIISIQQTPYFGCTIVFATKATSNSEILKH